MNNKISVVVPVYNSKKYLTSCVDSILAQTYSNIELVLVDDGSTDGSSEICKKYANENKNVFFYEQKNSGAGTARFFGMKKTTGNIIMFVDSDDFIDEKTASVVANCFNKYDVDIVRFQGRRWPNGECLERIRISDDFEKLSRERTLDLLIFSDKLSSMCLQAYKRKCLNNVEFARGVSYCEDYITNQRIHNKERKIAVINDTLYYYRNNNLSTTKTINLDKLWMNIDERIIACSETVEFIRKYVNDNVKKMEASGFQIERMRLDVLKYLVRCRGREKKIKAIKKLFNSREYNELLKKIDPESVELFLRKIGFKRHLEIAKTVKSLYYKNVLGVLWSAREYGILLLIRNMRIKK